LTISPAAGPAHLFGISAGEGGVAGFSDKEVWAWKPGANCDGRGSFKHVATLAHDALFAALSNDGNWVASTDGAFIDLTPRSDGASGLTAQKLQLPVSGNVRVAFHDNR